MKAVRTLGYDQPTDDQKDAISSFLSIQILLETMAWLADRPGTSGKFVTAPNRIQ